MFHDFSYGATLASSIRAAWRIEDVLPEGARLDFNSRFMPEGACPHQRRCRGCGDEQRHASTRSAAHGYL